MKYSVDTSALIDAWRKLYPPDGFPSFWDRIKDLVEAGEMRAIDEVIQEIDRKDDDLHKWVAEQSDLSIDIASDEALQDEVTTILQDYPKLLDTRRGRSGADPWVIALAKVNSCTVVTQEVATGKPSRPHIPDVCAAIGVKSMSVLDLIRAEGWQF